MERNLSLYPFYQIGRHTLFWVPVFFLYFSSLLTIDEVLALEALYYFSVVVLEVPSGYLSDRIGRRVTLVMGNAATVAAFVLFEVYKMFWSSWIVRRQLFALDAAADPLARMQELDRR